MKLVKIQQSEIPNLLQIGLNNYPCVMYVIYDKPFVWIMHDRNCDFEKVKELGIDYLELPNSAGSTIVASVGDLDFGLFGNKDFCEKHLKEITDYVSLILKDGVVINNDMMYDGYKYGAISQMQIDDDKWFYAVHVSSYIDRELISEICTKVVYNIPNELPIKIKEIDLPEIFKGESL